MIPMVKTSSVFRSRWKALLWTVPIIWFAYDFASSDSAPDTNSINAEEPTDTTEPTETMGDTVTPANKIPATWN
jgi:hypothetical protein